MLGIGNSVLMVVSVSLECDLIGENTESGAFVCTFLLALVGGLADLEMMRV